MNGITDTVAEVDAVFLYIIGVSLGLLLLITVLMIYFAIRFRRSRNPEPADIRGNWQLEATWTVIPTIIALSMFYLGWQSYLGLRRVPPGTIDIEVIGQQYSWVFIYPNGKAVADELVVPKGKPIKLNVTSEDVIHSLYIPAFRIKVDAVRGMETHEWFLADEIGEYDIMCAEYCGAGHADMTAVLRIVDEPDYQAWLGGAN